MSKSFPIKQSMREDIAHRLTVQAVHDAAVNLRSKVRDINDVFWEMHLNRIHELLGLPANKWPMLMDIHMVMATTSILPETWRPYTDDREGGLWDDAFRRKVSEPVINVLADPQIGLYDSSHGLITRRRYCRGLVVLSFRYQDAVPRYAGMEHITDSNLLAWIEEFAQEFDRVHEAADDFYKRTMAVLEACRSSRQMEDLFPEAAKLLPRAPSEGKQAVPKEQIDRVRQLLESGVPA